MNDALWTRYLEGAALSPAERAELEAELEDPLTLAERLDDLEVHRALCVRLGPATEAPVEPPRRVRRRAGAVLAGALGGVLLLLAGFLAGRGATPAEAPLGRLVLEPRPGLAADPGAAPERSLARGPLELSGGPGTLHLACGVAIEFEGSLRARLEDAHTFVLDQGRVAVRVPARLAAFTLRTPAARMVDSGTWYEVEVQGDGRTFVQLLEGDLRIEPGREGEWSGRDLRLARGGLVQARVGALVEGRPLSPLVAEAEGAPGEFAALVVARERYFEVARPRLLENVRDYFARLLEERPEQLDQEWQRLAFHGRAPSIQLGSGAELELTSLDAVLEPRGLVARQFLASDPRVAASFLLPLDPSSPSGVVRIGSAQYRFDDYESLIELLEGLSSGYARRFTP